MNGQRDLGDVDVLLEVEQAHLQFRDLLLHARRHLVSIPSVLMIRIILFL